MKTKNLLSSLTVATALLATLVTARADSGLPAAAQPVDTSIGQGLLGQVYGNLTYSYVNLDSTSVHADDYHFELSQPLSFGLDGFLSYDFTDYSAGAGHQNTFMAGLRPFSTRFNWGKPYAEVGAGYAWTGGEDSFVWEAAIGAEFQVNPKTTVTPYIQYADAPDLPGEGRWNFGVKGNYWVNSQWAVTAGFQLNDNNDSAFTIGTNFRY